MKNDNYPFPPVSGGFFRGGQGIMNASETSGADHFSKYTDFAPVKAEFTYPVDYDQTVKSGRKADLFGKNQAVISVYQMQEDYGTLTMI